MAAGETALVTVNEVLTNYDFIDEFIFRERHQGYHVADGAYDRIKATIIEAMAREVTFNNG